MDATTSLARQLNGLDVVLTIMMTDADLSALVGSSFHSRDTRVSIQFFRPGVTAVMGVSGSTGRFFLTHPYLSWGRNTE